MNLCCLQIAQKSILHNCNDNCTKLYRLKKWLKLHQIENPPLVYRTKLKQLLTGKTHPVLSDLRGPSLNCHFHHRASLTSLDYSFCFNSGTVCSSWLHASHHLLLNFAEPKLQPVSSHFAMGTHHHPPAMQGHMPRQSWFPRSDTDVNHSFQCREHSQEIISIQVIQKQTVAIIVLKPIFTEGILLVVLCIIQPCFVCFLFSEHKKHQIYA